MGNPNFHRLSTVGTWSVSLLLLALVGCAGGTSESSGGSTPTNNSTSVSTGQSAAPTISGTPVTTAVVGTAYSFQPSAWDTDGGALTFSIANKPTWASFDLTTGKLAGTPTSADVGMSAAITINVSDGEQSAELNAFQIDVERQPVTPAGLQITGTPPTSVEAGSHYTFQPSVSAPSNVKLTFSAKHVPGWASFNVQTGQLSGTPSSQAAGTYSNLSISVSDGQSTASLNTFSINVKKPKKPPQPPTISGSPSTQINAGQSYNFTPAVTNPGGLAVKFAINNKPDWASFSAATGELRGTPSNSQVGNYSGIVISVSDAQGSAALNPFNVAVNPTTAPPAPPTISGSPATEVQAAEPYSFTPVATDPSGTPLTFSIVNPPSWAAFNASTGQLSGTPTAGNVGTTSGIVISVSDGQGSASLPAFSLQVTADPPPSIGGTPAAQVQVGQTYSFTPTASAPNGATLTFSVQNLPAWAGFNNVTGQLSGTPDSTVVGTYSNIVISVSDGQASASLTPFSIQVTGVSPPPPPPTIGGTPPATVQAGQSYSFTPTASGPAGTTLSFSVQNLPGWASFSIATGQLSGTPSSAQVATYGGIVISVSDGQASASLPAFSIQVTAASTPPTLTLSASPTLVASGGSSTLSWSSTNTTACTASGGWSGSQSTSGTASTGSLNASSTFTLTCTGSDGSSVSQSASVAVSSGGGSAGASCSSTSGALTLNAKVVRSSGISPLLVFFDATGTSDSSVTGGATAFQDVSYSWNFGDTNASGTGHWAYGSNAGHNSTNSATGAVAAHLYVTPGSDTGYTVTVTAYDGTNQASCQLGVNASDPAGVNGFAGTNTTCVSASGIPTPGAADCPVGAAVLQTSSLSTALGSAFGSGKRVLFKCGDSFSGSYTIAAGATTWSIGAYGGCENTQSNRPIFNVPSGGSALNINSTNTSPGPIDGRITDIDFEGNGAGMVALTTTAGFNIKQITLYNLYAHGLTSSYYISGGTQIGIVGSVMNGMGAKEGVFWNYAENNCLNGSPAANCGGSPSYADVDYTAVLGNNFNGVGVSTNNTWETFRISACRLCVLANNNFSNASPTGGATFKLHSGNTWNSSSTWIGQYTEMVEISDNLFGGTSGAQLVEISPQNSANDERLRNIIVERNLFAGTTAVGRDVLVSASNVSLRDNVFYAAATGVEYGAQIAQRSMAPVPQYVEFYNNTCYASTSMQACAGFDGTNFNAPGVNGWAMNNLFYDNASSSATIVNNGSGNSVSNNTTNSSANPSMSAGSFNALPDFAPSADYSGGTRVPVWYDALGATWTGGWDLGAVHP